MKIIRQRNFNIISDIKHSGIGRTWKKKVGQVRKKLAKKFDKSIKRDLKKKEEIEKEGRRLGLELHRNQETTKLAENKISDIKSKGDVIVTRHKLGPYFDKVNNELVLPNAISAGELGHELGHIKNSRGDNGAVAKKVHELGQSNENLRSIYAIDCLGSSPEFSKKRSRNSFLENLGYDSDEIKSINDFLSSPKLSDIKKRLKKGKYLIQDEKNASKSGLKDIKGLIPKKIFKLEKKRQKIGNKTYQKSMLISSKLPLRNKIQIPSRRGEFY